MASRYYHLRRVSRSDPISLLFSFFFGTSLELHLEGEALEIGRDFESGAVEPRKFDTIVSIVANAKLGTTTITAVAGLASQLWDIPRYVITFIDAGLYLLLTSLLPQKGGLISQVQFKILTATTVSSSVMLIIFMIFDIAKFPPNEFFFLVLALVWRICYMIVHCAANRSVIRHMQTLDAIDYDKGEFEAVKTPREACGLIVSGFRMAHPVCISHDLVKLAIDRWPTNVDLWLIFAKFTAIYPELKQQLSYVSMGLIQNHLKGSLSKQIQQQIQSVMRQRETNLIQQLKSKLEYFLLWRLGCRRRQIQFRMEDLYFLSSRRRHL